MLSHGFCSAGDAVGFRATIADESTIASCDMFMDCGDLSSRSPERCLRDAELWV